MEVLPTHMQTVFLKLRGLIEMNLEAAAMGIDCEGCISITRRGEGLYRLVVTFTNTGMVLLRQFQKTFGGRIYPKVSSSRGNRRLVYDWMLVGPSAAQFLKQIQPYLLLKRKQAKLGIQFQTFRKRVKRTEKQKQRDMKMYLQSRFLNRRGKA